MHTYIIEVTIEDINDNEVLILKWNFKADSLDDAEQKASRMAREYIESRLFKVRLLTTDRNGILL